MVRSRVINTVGACFTAVVLVIVLISKFASGAWIVVVAMPVIWLTMRGIHRHYDSVAVELTPPEDSELTLPASNRAIVLVSKLHLPTLRALAYARATQPSHLEAVTVDVDEAETLRLKEEWDRADIPVPLTVVASPYREITRPVVEYVKRLRRESPRDIVTLYMPEYVLGHWWEQLLHNQSALRLKAGCCCSRAWSWPACPTSCSSAHAGNSPKRRAAAAQRRPGPAAAADRGHRGAARRGTAARSVRTRAPRPSPTQSSTSTLTWPARCARSPCGRGAPA